MIQIIIMQAPRQSPGRHVIDTNSDPDSMLLMLNSLIASEENEDCISSFDQSVICKGMPSAYIIFFLNFSLWVGLRVCLIMARVKPHEQGSFLMEKGGFHIVFCLCYQKVSNMYFNILLLCKTTIFLCESNSIAPVLVCLLLRI